MKNLFKFILPLFLLSACTGSDDAPDIVSEVKVSAAVDKLDPTILSKTKTLLSPNGAVIAMAYEPECGVSACSTQVSLFSTILGKVTDHKTFTNMKLVKMLISPKSDYLVLVGADYRKSDPAQLITIDSQKGTYTGNPQNLTQPNPGENTLSGAISTNGRKVAILYSNGKQSTLRVLTHDFDNGSVTTTSFNHDSFSPPLTRYDFFYDLVMSNAGTFAVLGYAGGDFYPFIMKESETYSRDKLPVTLPAMALKDL